MMYKVPKTKTKSFHTTVGQPGLGKADTSDSSSPPRLSWHLLDILRDLQYDSLGPLP